MSKNSYGILYNPPDPTCAADPRGMGVYFMECMKRYSENIAQVDGETGESQTYAEVLQRSIRVALEMKRRGLKENDIITLCSYNHMDCVLPFLAALFLGVHVSSLDPTLPESDVEHLLELVKPRLIFCGEESLQIIGNAVKKKNLKTEIVVYGKSERYTSFSEFLVENIAEKKFEAQSVKNIDDTAVIFFSSGTTGLPKAVCCTHRGLISQQKNFLKGSDVTTVMYFTTFYWISSVMLLTMNIIKGGKRVICKKFSVDSVLSIIDKYQVTFAFMAPYHISQILLHYKSIDLKVSHFKSLVVGGGKVSEEHVLQMRKLLPPHVYISLCYGMTELCGCITSFNQEKDKIHILTKPTSSGKPYSGIDYKIVDVKTDEVVGPNKIGEIRVRSKYLMNGYLNDPKSMESSIDEEGYFCTGDIGYYDEDHCFFIVDRIKDIMKYQSWHIVPKELEDILVAHPDIREAAVVGRPHDIDGEHATAFIVLQPKSQISKNEIMDYYNGKIGNADRKKLRGGIEFIDSIPRTPTGKIKRLALKELYFSK